MNSQTCPFFSDICDGRLFALNECLPSLDELSSQNDGSGIFVPTDETCRDVMCNCEAISNEKMNYPARMMELPLADMCSEKATSSGTFSDVPARYELFQDVCMNGNFDAVAAANDNEFVVDQTNNMLFVNSTVNTTEDGEVNPATMIPEISNEETTANTEIPTVTTIPGMTSEEIAASTEEPVPEMSTDNSNIAAISREIVQPVEGDERTNFRNGLLVGIALVMVVLLLVLVCCLVNRSCRRRRRKQRQRFLIVTDTPTKMVSEDRTITSQRDIVLTKDSVASQLTTREEEDTEVATF